MVNEVLEPLCAEKQVASSVNLLLLCKIFYKNVSLILILTSKKPPTDSIVTKFGDPVAVFDITQSKQASQKVDKAVM